MVRATDPHEAAGLSSVSATSTLLQFPISMFLQWLERQPEYKGKGIPGSHL